MSKFEIDDNVEIINVNFLTKHERSTFNVKIGYKGKIIGFYKPSPVFAIVANNNFTNSNAGEGKLFVPVSSLQKLNSFYLESNRYKLSQAIKSTGFHAEKLSLETGHAKTYFAGFTAESRFNSRGDITEERLNSLLTTLAFAERELLGVGAKTVDENNVPVVVKNTNTNFNPAQNSLGDYYSQIGLSNNPCHTNRQLQNNAFGFGEYMAVPCFGAGIIEKEGDQVKFTEFKSISNDLFETNIKETLADLDDALKANKSDTNKSNLNKFLIIFVLVLLALALWFFVR